MTKKFLSRSRLDAFISISGAVLGMLAMLICSNISKTNNFVAGFTLIATAVFTYLVIVLFSSKRNWLDVRAVFSGVWLGTIGLAALRLAGYQEVWQLKTWLLLSLSYLSFHIGANAGVLTAGKVYEWLLNKSFGINFKKVSFSFKNQRLYLICVIATIIGIVSFVINVFIKGYIPCFSADPHAYANFYTRIQTFSVAAMGASALCYYCIKTQSLSIAKKIILYLCMLYHTFLYPILIASRGTFLAGAISVTVVVFYLNKRRFISLLLCVIVMFSIYIGCSYLRNYSDAQLSAFFEPKEIVVSEGETNKENEENDDKQQIDDTKHPMDDSQSQTDDSQITTFSLPPKVAWVYTYLTVSHDNFNEAVENTQNFTLGARQFGPFNVIIRSSKIESIINNAEVHYIREHLNTTNLIGDFYYDFSSIGVGVCMLIWAYLIGLNQAIAFKEKNWIALMLLGNSMVPMMLSFFATWFSIFSQWMLWGVVLIFAVASTITIKSTK